MCCDLKTKEAGISKDLSTAIVLVIFFNTYFCIFIFLHLFFYVYLATLDPTMLQHVVF